MNERKIMLPVSIYTLLTVVSFIWVTIYYLVPFLPSAYPILLVYLFLALFLQSLPLKIGPIHVVMTLVVSIAVLIEFGLVAEIWLTQIVLLIGMLISSERRSNGRILFTHLMFFWISLLSGLVYLWVRNSTDVSDFTTHPLLPIIFYGITSFFVNHVLLHFSHRLLFNQRRPIFSEDTIWDAITLLITVPLGILMYNIRVDYDIFGILLVALPILLISHMFKIYVELNQSHQVLKTLNKVSSSFTSELDHERTIQSLQQAIRELFVFDYSFLFLKEGTELKPISVERFDGEVVEQNQCDLLYLKEGEGLTGKVAKTQRAEIVGTDAELFELDIEPECIKGNKSLLSVPIIWNQQVIGVITLGSQNEYQFTKKDMTMALILASQAAVAIKNSRDYQTSKEKSKMDELTGVYNYRGFEEILNQTFTEAENRKEKLSLLLIDIDFFKQVNDKYGHLAGNDVLRNLADRLQKWTRKQDVVARYGGEEFVVILPNTDSAEGLQLGERIRQLIEEEKFIMKQTLQHGQDIEQRITASIGVASFPTNADSIQDLVRNADRAMYIGSKQAGRNRVSVYTNNTKK